MNIVSINPNRLNIPTPIFDYSGCFIGGGMIRDSIAGEQYVDVDVFGPAANLKEFEEKNLKNCKLVHEDKFVKTYLWQNKKIQVINREVNTPDDFIKRVDFTICQFTWDGKELKTTPEALVDLFNKKLVVNKLTFPLDSLRRLQKYIQKGYTACNGTLKEISDTIRGLDEKEYVDQMAFYDNGKPRIIRFD